MQRLEEFSNEVLFDIFNALSFKGVLSLRLTSKYFYQLGLLLFIAERKPRIAVLRADALALEPAPIEGIIDTVLLRMGIKKNKCFSAMV